MENPTDLDTILNGASTTEAPPQEAEAAPVETTQEARPRDEHGRFAPKGETGEAPPAEAAPPAASDDEGPLVPRKALQDERGKRQTIEAELQRMQRQLQDLQNPPRPPEPPPSIWDDDQAWQQHFGQTVVQQAVRESERRSRMATSEMLARQAYPDFEDKKAAFIAAIENNEALAERALQDPHPWNFAYTYVSNQERMQELSAVNVADLEAKLRAQIEAEYAAKGQDALKLSLPAGVPPSLSQERNVGSRQGPSWAGPAALGDILNRPR